MRRLHEIHPGCTRKYTQSTLIQKLSLRFYWHAQVSILPPVAAIAVSAIAGPTADSLLAKGVPVAKVRKAAQVSRGAGQWGRLAQPYVPLCCVALEREASEGVTPT